MSEQFWAAAISCLDGSAKDGVHLLWAPPLPAGYSVHGFDVQRRAARDKRRDVCITLTGAELALLHQRLWLATTLAMITVNRTACPSPPDRVPDEPFAGDPADEPRPRECVDFGRLKTGDGPNPLVLHGVRFTRFDASGAPAPASMLVRDAAETWLECRSRLEIEPTAPTSEVELMLRHTSRPARVAALDRNGAVVATASMRPDRNIRQTLTLRGQNIVRVVVSAPAAETFLLSFCYALERSRCVSFGKGLTDGANPRIEQGLAFDVVDHKGARAKATVVRRVNGLAGLDCGGVTTVRLDGPARVNVTLLVEAGSVVVIAFDRAGVEVDRASAKAGRQPQSLQLRGSALAQLRIESSKAGTCLLLVLCVDAPPKLSPVKRLERLRLRRLTSGINLPVTIAPAAPAAPAIAMAVATQGCLRYTIALREVHRRVRVEIGTSGALAIARRAGKAVATALASEPSGVQHFVFADRPVDEVVVYVPHPARSLRVCVDDLQDPKAEAQEWAGEPYLARGIQLPVRAVNGALLDRAGELALATSRLLPGEAIDAARFDDVADLMNEVAAPASIVSPVLRSTRTRERAEDPFIELRSWGYALSLLANPGWRRALGFGYFDRGGGLTPGTAYDYRITGYFRRRDLEETVFGFHTVPSGTALPSAFHLGVIRVSTREPATVELFPNLAASSLQGTGRKGLRLSGSQRITLTFPTAIEQLVLELEPIAGHALSYRARTSDYVPGLSGTTVQAPIPADRRVSIEFPEPVDTVQLRGVGFVYAIRVAGGGRFDDVIASSVVMPGVRYEPTPLPDPPAFLGTVNLQEPSLPGDPAVTTQAPPQSLGFRLSWLPPPVSGAPPLLPWPADLDAVPPFDMVGFHLERRRVDVPSPFRSLDGEPDTTLFVGNRGSRSDLPPLAAGVDLLDVFPEDPRPVPPVSQFMSADDVLLTAEAPGPPPGSRHQYRISSVDVIGRLSMPRVGSTVRLEKRRAPPQPVAPDTVFPAGVIVPSGVRARLLQAADPDLTAADRTLLGASTNAIVIEWGWTQQERDRDPYAREFRIYWQPSPPDIIAGVLVGPAVMVAGRWNMSAQFDRAVTADAMVGRYVRAGGRPFRVADHGAGFAVTITFDPSAIEAAAAPVAGSFDFRPKLEGGELRPTAWAERIGVVAIGPGAPAPFLLRDAVTLDASHPGIRVWVGVSAADDQAYIPDEIPVGSSNGGRPGNESSIASVVVQGRYLGRPVFVVPPPLPDVPEQVSREPLAETVPVPIDLPALLPAVAVPAAHTVFVERLSSDALLTMMGATADDRIGVSFPDGTVTSYQLGNPGDHAALLAQIRTGTPGRVEGRFLMDFLLRFPAQLEPLWRRALAQPQAWGGVTDLMPAKPERHIHRTRLVDPAGHVSTGAAIVPQIVRVASLRVPRAPEFTVASDETNLVTVTATVTDSYDLQWVVFFALAVNATAPLDDTTLAKAQLVRLPDRRDLYPNDGLRLRLADGALLSPQLALDLVGAGVVAPPSRTVPGSLDIGFDRRVAVWAVTLTRDGIPSRFAGPRVALTGAAPLVVPALAVLAGATSDDAAWTPLAVPADVSIERSLDAGVSWTRVSPWLAPSVESYSVSRGTAAPPRLYRLALRATRSRVAVGSGVAPA